MRTLALAAPLAGLLFVACANTPEALPEGRTTTPVIHPKYDEIRPSAIVVLKVDAPDRDMRQLLRPELYDQLFKKDYSCPKLQSVDKQLANGKIDARKLPYDATFHVKIDSWKPYRGGRYYAATGTATMIHRQGETLLTIRFVDEVFQAKVDAGASDDTGAIKLLAKRIVKWVPPHPRLPAE